MPPRGPRCPALLAREWCVAKRLTGGQVEPRAASWRAMLDNPSGRGCLPAIQRHHSVVYGRTLPRSSLACAQTAPGAGHVETWSRP